jgi:hypothetical protein
MLMKPAAKPGLRLHPHPLAHWNLARALIWQTIHANQAIGTTPCEAKSTPRTGRIGCVSECPEPCHEKRDRDWLAVVAHHLATIKLKCDCTAGCGPVRILVETLCYSHASRFPARFVPKSVGVHPVAGDDGTEGDHRQQSKPRRTPAVYSGHGSR